MQKFWKEVKSWQDVENRLRRASFRKFANKNNQFCRATATQLSLSSASVARGKTRRQRLFPSHNRHAIKNYQKAKP